MKERTAEGQYVIGTSIPSLTELQKKTPRKEETERTKEGYGRVRDKYHNDRGCSGSRTRNRRTIKSRATKRWEERIHRGK